MIEKKCRNPISWLLLIIVALALSSCPSEPEIIEKEVVPVALQKVPLYPVLTWELNGERFSLSEADFDDLQAFFDDMDGYYEKVKLYQ